MLHIPLLRHSEKCRYVRGLSALMRGFCKDMLFDMLDLCCWDGTFDCFYLVYHGEHWRRDLDFEGHQRRSLLKLRFFGWYEMKALALSHRDRESVYAAVSEN